jgi:hypothetical protein
MNNSGNMGGKKALPVVPNPCLRVRVQCAERDTISCTFADNGQCFFPLLLRYFRYFRDASFDWACGTTYVAARRVVNI